MRSSLKLFSILVFFLFVHCKEKSSSNTTIKKTEKVLIPSINRNHDSITTVHVFVALCDNIYQGIVPVGKAIGNGQDPDNNLYWGAAYGLRSFFNKKSSNWKQVHTQKNLNSVILERIVFKHKTKPVFLLADAYNGKFIREATINFLEAAAGRLNDSMGINHQSIKFGSSSTVLAYIGHDGLMDFTIPLTPPSVDTMKRSAIILACYSKHFFSPHLKRTGAYPLIWTTGLMAPEAYTLHDALEAWINKKDGEAIRNAAASAYARFQHCSLKAARNLFASGEGKMSNE
jgi:hypothetical protein